MPAADPIDVSQTARPAVWNQPPPALVRAANPLIRVLLRSPIGRRMAPLGLLRFKGRRTGRALEVPVGIHDVDGTLTVFSDRPWRLNFRGGTAVEAVIGGQARSGSAELIEDAGVVGPAMLTALRQVKKPRMLGLGTSTGHEPTAAELGAVGRSIIRLHVD